MNEIKRHSIDCLESGERREADIVVVESDSPVVFAFFQRLMSGHGHLLSDI